MNILNNKMNPEDIQDFLTHANEISLALFKQNKDFIVEYVKTKEMSKKDKLNVMKIVLY